MLRSYEPEVSKAPVRDFAEKIMDWGNLVFVGLVIGQLVPGTMPFRWTLFILGILCFFVAYGVGRFLMKGGE